MQPADCPESAVKYLEALSTDATEEGELYFFLPYASGSDYSGSTVEKANCREFLESYGEEVSLGIARGPQYLCRCTRVDGASGMSRRYL